MELTDEEIRTIARIFGLSVLQARQLRGASYAHDGILAAWRSNNPVALRAFLRALGLPSRANREAARQSVGSDPFGQPPRRFVNTLSCELPACGCTGGPHA